MLASSWVIRWALLLATYKFRLIYTLGKQHVHCDALSRLSLPDTPKVIPTPAETLQLIEFMEAGPVSVAHVRDWTSRGPVLSAVLRFVREGWPANAPCLSEVGTYKSRMNKLSIHGDCFMWGSRVIISPQGRETVLAGLHEEHFGASRMKSRCRAYFWWPELIRI